MLIAYRGFRPSRECHRGQLLQLKTRVIELGFDENKHGPAGPSGHLFSVLQAQLLFPLGEQAPPGIKEVRYE
jgi:hypothetical protein